MGVSLQTGQSQFASIIEELSQVPTTLSQFFVWVDLCIAEYKIKGFVSLNCSGRKPDPDWLNGLKEILASSNALQLHQNASRQIMSSENIYKDRQRELETASSQYYHSGQATIGKSNISVQGQSIPGTIQTSTPKTIQYIYVQPKVTSDVSENQENKTLRSIETSLLNTFQVAKNNSQKENALVLQTDINGNNNNNLSVNSADASAIPGKLKPGTEMEAAVNSSQKESVKSVVPVSLYLSPQRPVNSVNKVGNFFQNNSPKALNKCFQSPAASSRTKRKSLLISNFLETAKLQNTIIKTEVLSDDENNSGSATITQGNCSKLDDFPLVITDIRTEINSCLSASSRVKHNNDNPQDYLMAQFSATVKTEPLTTSWQGKHRRSTSKDYVPGPVKKARTNVGNMQVWLRDVYAEERQIEDMPPQELDKYLSEFLMDVRKRNGEDYDPNSFKDIRGSFERHLHDRGYPYSIIKSGLFAKTQKAYIQKRDILRNVLQYKMLNNDNRIL